MLVGHLRFGADAARRVVEGVLNGGPTVMYPGGEAQRDAEIAGTMGRSASELASDLRAGCAELEEAFAMLGDDSQGLLVETRRGPVPVRELLFQRWVDVEAHHVDLDVGYRPEDWPQSLVDAYLPGLVEVTVALRQRPDADHSLAGSWHLHRTDGHGEWTLRAEGAAATVSQGHGKADAAIRATGHQLMALLLGRADVATLDVFGDEALAGTFKRAFPGP